MNGAQETSTFEGVSKFQVLKTNLANWKALKFIHSVGKEKLNKINKQICVQDVILKLHNCGLEYIDL